MNKELLLLTLPIFPHRCCHLERLQELGLLSVESRLLHCINLLPDLTHHFDS
jgi:hypothetical protein